jgi:hypothetical protein
MSPSGRSRVSGTDRSSRPALVLVIPQAEVSDCEGPSSTKKESKNQ